MHAINSSTCSVSLRWPTAAAYSDGADRSFRRYPIISGFSDIEALLGGDEFPVTPNMTSTRRFRVKLKGARVIPEPTSAAPGTSDHGQGNAVDFVVVRGNKKVADTKTSEIRTRWKAEGWEDRLIAAIEQCNQEQLRNPIRPAPQLSGPLKKPYEPWHWVLSYSQPNA